MSKSVIRKVVEHAGGHQALADSLDLESRQVVQGWERRGRIPPKYCVPIEDLTRGKFTAKQLRPDVFR